MAAEQRGDRSAKPSPQAQSRPARRLRREDRCRFRSRIGASKDIPIAIEDESSEEEIEKGMPKRSLPFRNRMTASLPTPPPQSKYSPHLSDLTSVPRYGRRDGISASSSSPIAEDNTRLREPSIYIDPPKHTRPAPGGFEYRSVLRGTNLNDTSRQKTGQKEQAEAQSQPSCDAAQEMTLSDIPDFGTRKKVADLMAVAPALPVRDLYNLLHDVNGHLIAARRRVIRASRAPSVRPIVKREGCAVIAAPCEAIQLRGEKDDNEVMVKIDPNDPFLEWDSDTPPPETTLQRNLPATARSKARTSKTKNRPNIGAKRTGPPQARNRRDRGNSIDGTFVVPDHIVHLDTDTSCSDTENSDSTLQGSDSDVEMVNTVHENVEDLRIDMRSKYAYNSRILGKKKN
ncbi:hypothetical protein BDU57DRAFT_541555 [Ampelomyces quisqualis]|uniref:Uncharacterized protein n=1 Tax=Ampelomyces quisqualis TaxID=50730 RepID=A0A6A5QDA5_AMPQU|nr:hypothetical protein BDU57DRAFT_541555 [Ampelomyces quisqualis]